MKAIKLAYLALENPGEYEGRRFKVVKGAAVNTDGEYIDTILVRDGEFVAENKKVLRAFVTSNTEVEEIPQYIPFMDAVEKYRDKYLVCDYNGKSKEYSGKRFTTYPDDVPVTFDEILHGKWYVK